MLRGLGREPLADQNIDVTLDRKIARCFRGGRGGVRSTGVFLQQPQLPAVCRIRGSSVKRESFGGVRRKGI